MMHVFVKHSRFLYTKPNLRRSGRRQKNAEVMHIRVQLHKKGQLSKLTVTQLAYTSFGSSVDYIRPSTTYKLLIKAEHNPGI